MSHTLPEGERMIEIRKNIFFTNEPQVRLMMAQLDKRQWSFYSHVLGRINNIDEFINTYIDSHVEFHVDRAAFSDLDPNITVPTVYFRQPLFNPVDGLTRHMQGTHLMLSSANMSMDWEGKGVFDE